MRKPSIAKTIAKNRSSKKMPGMKAMAPMAPMVPAMKNGGAAKKPKVGIAIMIAVGKKGKK